MALVQPSHHSGVHMMSDKLWAPTVWDQLEGSVEVADLLLKPMRQIHEHGPPTRPCKVIEHEGSIVFDSAFQEVQAQLWEWEVWFWHLSLILAPGWPITGPSKMCHLILHQAR